MKCLHGLSCMRLLQLHAQPQEASNVIRQSVRCVGGQVTPSSKVVGDLAQFMVQNQLDDTKLVEKASSLNLPDRLSSFYTLSLCQLCHSSRSFYCD